MHYWLHWFYCARNLSAAAIGFVTTLRMVGSKKGHDNSPEMKHKKAVFCTQPGNKNKKHHAEEIPKEDRAQLNLQ